MTNKKNSGLFSDQSNSSRIERIKASTLQTIKQQSTPKSGYDNLSRNDALTRVRAGGYMVAPGTARNTLPPIFSKR